MRLIELGRLLYLKADCCSNAQRHEKDPYEEKLEFLCSATVLKTMDDAQDFIDIVVMMCSGSTCNSKVTSSFIVHFDHLQHSTQTCKTCHF